MGSFRSSTNQQNQQDYSGNAERRLELQQAGLQLREQQMAQSDENAGAALALRQAEHNLNATTKMFETSQKIQAMNQVTSFLQKLPSLNPEDPDFDGQLATLMSAHPAAAMHERVNEWVGAKQKLALTSREARQKASIEFGVDRDQFAVRDPKTNRFLGYDDRKYGAAIQQAQLAKAANRVKLATSLGGKADVTIDDKDGATVKTEVQTPLSKLEANAGVIAPGQELSGLANKLQADPVTAAVIEGKAKQGADKAAAQQARITTEERKLKLRALVDSDKIMDAGLKSELKALLDEPSDATGTAATPAAPAAAAKDWKAIVAGNTATK